MLCQMPGSSSPPPPPSPSSPDLLCQPCSGPRRTSSSRSQWAASDLICQLWLAVALPGPPLPALDRSAPRRTSTGESLLAVGLAGPDSEHCGPRRDSARRGPRRTSTGPQRPEKRPYRMPKRMPDRSRIECQKICQIECQKICQIECQKICQIECQKIC